MVVVVSCCEDYSRALGRLASFCKISKPKLIMSSAKISVVGMAGNLKTAVYMRSGPHYMIDVKRFCVGEWYKLATW